jgi:hypothetical protein
VSGFDPFGAKPKDQAASEAEVKIPAVPKDDALREEQARRLAVAPPLEEYVAGEVAITQSMIARGVFKDEDDPKGRIERTAAYARWRWNGWIACEIESL